MLSRLDRLGQLPRWMVVAACTAGIAIVGWIDYATGYEAHVTVFYLAPVFAATWLAGRRYGLLFAFLSAVTEMVSDLAAGGSYSHPAILFWNTLANLAFFVLFVGVLSALIAALQRERELASTDFLTGIANRRVFTETLGAEMDRSRRYAHPFTLVYLDCDNFKSVNDALGHQEGNAVLQAIAVALRATIRRTDLCARLGGDEFTVLLPEAGRGAARAVLNRLERALNEAMARGGWSVKFSIGAATFVVPPSSEQDAIERADALMYRAKSEGKGKLVHEVYAATDTAGL